MFEEVWRVVFGADVPVLLRTPTFQPSTPPPLAHSSSDRREEEQKRRGQKSWAKYLLKMGLGSCHIKLELTSH